MIPGLLRTRVAAAIVAAIMILMFLAGLAQQQNYSFNVPYL
jgi:hypothetical protein